MSPPSRATPAAQTAPATASTPALGVLRTGVACAVGLSAAQACAAIRSAIDRFEESSFRDVQGEPILAAQAPLHLLDPAHGDDHDDDRGVQLSGASRCARLFERALEDCLGDRAAGNDSLDDPSPALDTVVLLTLLPSPGRAGVPEHLEAALDAVRERRGWRFHAHSRVFRHDRASLAYAVAHATALLSREAGLSVLIVGVDSLINAGAINHYLRRDRLQTDGNSNGFIPAEAAAAVWLAQAAGPGQLTIRACERALETITVLDTERKSRFEALPQASAAALACAGCAMHQIDARLVSASGEEYFFEELAMVLARTLREHRSTIALWHPADCIGEVGAAIGPLLLAVAHDAITKGYAPGPRFLIELSNDDGDRAALVLTTSPSS